MTQKTIVDVDIEGDAQQANPTVKPTTRSPTSNKSSKSKSKKSTTKSSTSEDSSSGTTTAKKRKRVIVVEDIDEDEDGISAEQIEDIANMAGAESDDYQTLSSSSTHQQSSENQIDNTAGDKKESSELLLDLIGAVLEDIRDVDIDHSISFHTNVYTSYLITIMKNAIYFPLIQSMYHNDGVLFKLQQRMSVATTPMIASISNSTYLGTAKALTIVGLSPNVDLAKTLIDGSITTLRSQQTLVHDWALREDNHSALYCIIATLLAILYLFFFRDTIDSFTGLPVKESGHSNNKALNAASVGGGQSNYASNGHNGNMYGNHPNDVTHTRHYENVDNEDDIDERYHSRKNLSGNVSNSSKENRKKSLAFNLKDTNNDDIIRPTTSMRGSIVASMSKMRRAVGSVMPTSRIFGGLRSSSNTSTVTPTTTSEPETDMDGYIDHDTDGSVKTHTPSWNTNQDSAWRSLLSSLLCDLCSVAVVVVLTEPPPLPLSNHTLTTFSSPSLPYTYAS